MEKQTIKVSVSSRIAQEYEARSVWGIDEFAAFPQGAGVFAVSAETAREMRRDAEFQANKRFGPSDMPAGVRRAYANLRDQLRDAVA